MKKLLLLFILSLLVVACGTAEDEDTSEPGNGQGDEVITDPVPEPDESDDPEEQAPEYEPIMREGTLIPIINVVMIEEQGQDYLTVTLEHTEEELSQEEQLMRALVASDQTGYQSFQELLEVTVEDSIATLVFSEEHMLASLASTESLHLNQMLTRLGAWYGIDELVFYVHDEPGIDYGQMGNIESLPLEIEHNRGYARLTESEADTDQAVYVPFYQLDQTITAESEFEDVIEAMTENQTDLFISAIPTDITIEDVSVEGEEAEISYRANNLASIEDFYQLIEGVVRDYEYRSIHLVNEAELTITTITIR
ncbi:hypothetical protein SAMN04488134_102221 [Amphibacillus marinus]|uniref:Sporulation and spore germination n=1 Tax=Amphibacillus marinus TaxID=872970 RepID=A0A1H8KBE5_9BACI|nr:hypothetical protein [Amphibacillus marinus]SEN89728.1 hypothetical protein SAMN04488134_102221 [Amphibacillus marinus]